MIAVADRTEAMLVGGRWIEPRRRNMLVCDPDNGRIIARVPSATADDVEKALAGAAHAANTARRLPTHERIRILHAVARDVEGSAEEYAQLVATEGIKTIREARREVLRCVETLRLSAEEARRLGGETINFDQRIGGEHKVGWWSRVPVGVVVAITPFNDPLNLVAHKVGPAIAAGNAVILKPHEATPLSALRLARAFESAGLPACVLQVITGEGRIIGDALVGDPRVAMVSFTGSRRVGEHVLATARLKRVQLELGGNCPAIVLDDADLDRAVAACVSGAFWAAGQNCLHVQRLLVHRRVAGKFRRAFVAATGRYRMGSKLAEETDMGPQLNLEAVRRLEKIVASASEAGARVLTGGAAEGTRFAPTLLDRVPPNHAAVREELFGPVTVLEEVSSYEEAVARANGSEYGMHAAIFTQNLEVALRAASDLDCGGVMVNESSDYRVDAMPFGGTKASGLGREGVRFSVEEMSVPKVVCIAREPLHFP